MTSLSVESDNIHCVIIMVVAGLQSMDQETPAENVFIAPSIHENAILAGTSYTYHSRVPKIVAGCQPTEYVLGVDEAGRGPVLGYKPFVLPSFTVC